jgi:hypothetical protein
MIPPKPSRIYDGNDRARMPFDAIRSVVWERHVSGHQKTYFSDHCRYLHYGVVLGLEMWRSLNRK